MKFNINNNDKIVIKISNEDMDKIEKVILKGNSFFKNKLFKIKTKDLLSIKNYDYKLNKEITQEHRNLVIKIIEYVINNYKEELESLETVFLACSFGRQTNKIESDLDLHFIYKNNEYKYQYEEIVCYIITTILEKKRDDIDPKLIINFNKKLKKETEINMTDNNLEIILKSDDKEIKYSYLANKKKKFFLQYNNSKTIKDLSKYILSNGILEYNYPWAHSYDIIYGNETFEKMYLKILNIEKETINNEYYMKQVNLLIKEINLINLDSKEKNIAKIKENYQSKVFTSFYKYINIVRIYYMKKGFDIKYLRIYDLYEFSENRFKKVIDRILIYIWKIKNLSKYCDLNNVNYSIHINNIISNYDLESLKEEFLLTKKEILNSLKEMED